MKQILLVILISIGLASASVRTRVPAQQRQDARTNDRDYLLNNNRVPKQPSQTSDEGSDSSSSSEEDEVGMNLIDACTECKDIVDKVNAIIDDDSKIARLKFMLSFACDLLSEESKEECKNMINNLDALIRELRPLMQDPQAFCQQIHLCGSGRLNRIMRVLLLIVKRQVYRIASVEQNNDVFCDECKFAVQEAKEMWDQQSIQTEVKQMLDQLCDYLQQYHDTCVNLIDAYFPQLVAEIDNLLSNPTETCTQLGMCNGRTISVPALKLFAPKKGRVTLHHQKKSVIMGFVNRMGRIQTQAGSNAECAVCLYSVTAILDTLKKNPDMIKRWADDVQEACEMLPSSLQPQCTDFLSIYLMPMLELMINNIQPREVCDLLRACNGQKFDESIVDEVGAVDGEVTCESCRLLAEFLKDEFQQQQFQDELKEELKYACNFVPGQYANKCEIAVNNYVPFLMDLIVTELDPDTICPEIKLCPPRGVDVVEPASNEVD